MVFEISVQESAWSVAEVSRRNITSELCEWKKLEALEKDVREDHVQVMLSIPPKFSVSELAGFLKGKFAIEICDKHLKLKKR